MPERAGVTSLVGKKSNKLKIAGDNVNLGLCDLRDYFASPLLIVQTLLISKKYKRGFKLLATSCFKPSFIQGLKLKGRGQKRPWQILAKLKIVKTTPNFACEFV